MNSSPLRAARTRLVLALASTALAFLAGGGVGCSDDPTPKTQDDVRTTSTSTAKKGDGADDMKSGPCSSARSARPCDPFTRDTRRGPLNLIKHSSSFTPLSPDHVIISDMGVGLAAQCRP